MITEKIFEFGRINTYPDSIYELFNLFLNNITISYIKRSTQDIL